MGSFRPAAARAAAPNARRRPRYRRTLCEPLEARHMMAVLGMGIQLRADNGGSAGELIESVTVNQTFFVDVLVEDQRSAPQGIVSLPTSLFWDVNTIELVESPTSPPDSELLTDHFPLNRAFDTYRPSGAGHVGLPSPLNAVPAIANLENLRGGALPSADQGDPIGTAADGYLYSRLHFRAIAAAENTPFTIELTGSMSFTDADPLEGINTLIDNTRVLPPDNLPAVTNEEELSVTEFIQVAAAPLPSSLSGFVYLDINETNGMLDRDASDVAVEFGLPNVTITLFIDDVFIAQTTTGADGGYQFDDLDEGVYRIVETQPERFISTGSSVGIVLPANMARGVAGDNEITDIRIALGEEGIDYNFGEIPVPDKRFFLASTRIRELTTEQTGIAAATVRGTDGVPETIRVAALDDALAVTVGNNPPESIPLAKARVLFVETDDGQDTVELVGTPADETSAMLPGSATLRRGADYADANYALLAVAASQVNIAGRGGEDRAVLRDAPTSEALAAAGDTATLTSTLQSGTLSEFEQIRALSLTRDGASDVDTLDEGMIDYVLSAVGKWQLI